MSRRVRIMDEAAISIEFNLTTDDIIAWNN